jgi:beta-glucanase (GH16 family)
MKFQTGDYVLWEGEIARVIALGWEHNPKNPVLALSNGWVTTAATIAYQQHPWTKPPGSNRWEPLGDQSL